MFPLARLRRSTVVASLVVFGLAARVAAEPAESGPDADGLVPWSLAARQAAEEARQADAASRQAGDSDEARRTLAALRAKAFDTAAAVRGDGRYSLVDIEDVFLEPAALAGRPVAMFAFASAVRVRSAPPVCGLSNGGGSPGLAASLASLPRERRRALLETQAHGRPRLLLVKGRLEYAAGISTAAPYLGVHDFIDVGPLPMDYDTPIRAVLAPSGPKPDVPLPRMMAEGRAALRQFRADTGWRAVPLQELLADTTRYMDVPVSVVGMRGPLNIGATTTVLLWGDEIFPQHGSIQTLVKASRAELKDMMSESGFFKTAVVRGRVRRGPTGVHYLETEAFRSLATCCMPSELEAEALPTTPAATLPPGKTAESEQTRDRAITALRESALAALAEATRGDRFRALEPAELFLAPTRFLGKPVAILAFASQVETGKKGVYCTLGDRNSNFLSLAVRLEGVAPEKRKRALAWDLLESKVLVVAMGTLRNEDGRIYLEATDLLEVGAPPKGTPAVLSRVLGHVSARPEPTPDEVRAQARAVVEQLVRDDTHRYIRFEDLLLGIEGSLGKPVSLLGVGRQLGVGGAVPYFRLATHSWASEALTVAFGRLSFAEQMRLVDSVAPPRVLAVRATVQKAANGALYLEADSVGDLGEASMNVDFNDLR